MIHHSGFVTAPHPLFLQWFHMFTLGFHDIGYHFVIDRDGSIYEGRPLALMGANAGETFEANQLAERARLSRDSTAFTEAVKLDPDYGSIGICLNGDFSAQGNSPSIEQLESLSNLLAYLQKRFSIRKDHILMHNEVRDNMLIPRGLKSPKQKTSCPGELAYLKLRAIVALLPD